MSANPLSDPRREWVGAQSGSHRPAPDGHARTRRYAGWASAGLLLAILPGNVQMSANYGKRAQRRATPAARAAFAGTVARLPLQLPLIRTALRAAGR